MACVGVAAFGGRGKNSPGDGDGDLFNYYADSKNVDVPFAILPVRAVHGEDPAAIRSREFGENETTDGGGAKRALEKESLEAAVTAFVGATREVFGGENGEVDRPVAQQTGEQKGEALEAGEVEFEGREFFDEMAIEHPNFGWPPATQAFFASFLFIFNELRDQFLSCSVIATKPLSAKEIAS